LPAESTGREPHDALGEHGADALVAPVDLVLDHVHAGLHGQAGEPTCRRLEDFGRDCVAAINCCVDVNRLVRLLGGDGAAFSEFKVT
jgi:hypothetical protein